MAELDIEDFKAFENRKVENNAYDNKEVLSIEKIESIYQEKIKKLQEEYKKILETEKKKSYEEGYKKGKEEAEKYFNNKLKEEIKKTIEEKEKEIQKYFHISQENTKKFLENLKKEYIKRLDFIDNLLISALEEILYYMYINPSNYEFLSKEIKKIILQIKNSSHVRLMISPSLYDFLKDLDIENIEIEINENLAEGDFIIEFDHVQLESNFKEKIKILKDEIKREIKKHTKI